MKRDMDLIRQILMEIEKHREPLGSFSLDIENHSPDEISYHVKLLAEAGLVEALDMSSFSGFEWQATSLTWHGHEFLDAARDETVWNKTKAVVQAQGGSLPFDVIKGLVAKAAAAAAGLS